MEPWSDAVGLEELVMTHGTGVGQERLGCPQAMAQLRVQDVLRPSETWWFLLPLPEGHCARVPSPFPTRTFN